ncbi:MAG: hydrogenase formation protein HypD [Clostridium cadaveris]|uniref:Hydrogenase maturation protein HypD n=1 Tax=Clostridium cadaveris TaxID=1529 RepID=A0A1I2JNT0_9CLOT|nr:hydrogenase formation protein HypD [Clostridium cadaveris]MDM8312692.1 hydrogenase formation protein HypD [Clostridium cadaveris]MDY4948112.1 hydrogenase formation protein HypD [Clostridium cadaveris]UFH66022.1 hydrogenase formation protein HypD [Clostridium cadaveris]SFF55788.1 Hydrogenase maturation protein HypD [Clostridium cadaveris]
MKSLECDRKINIMEVCGTHTMAILRSGIKDTLPKNINLISGPGCPVCVTPQGYIDAAIELSKRDDVIIATFGDMISVPATESSLNIQRALGKDIRVIYSPLEALKIAEKNLNKEVVFLGIGFETTAPLIALAIEKSRIRGIKNFSVFTSLKTMPEILRVLLKGEDIKIDGIICPGHVSTIIGEKEFKFLGDEFHKPAVIAGFGSRDVIAGIYILSDMIRRNKSDLKNIYSQYVRYDGNENAKALIYKVFEKTEGLWRGIGKVEGSGLSIKKEYEEYDAIKKFKIEISKEEHVRECICGEILKGYKKPKDCNFFGTICTPHNPIGVCMVSREGSCKIYYEYSRN